MSIVEDHPLASSLKESHDHHRNLKSHADHPTVSTLAGTPKEVQSFLRKLHVGHVLVVAIDGIKSSDFQTLAGNLTNVTSFMFEVLLEGRDQGAMKTMATALMPKVPPSPRLLKETAMLVQARKAVLESGDWLSASDIAKLAGLSFLNPSAQPNKWKKKGLIFAINHGGVDYFPGYGLNRDGGFRPVKALNNIIKIFAGHKDAWGMAYWFRSNNSFLGGKRPQDLLASVPERVIEAAMDEVQEIAHG